MQGYPGSISNIYAYYNYEIYAYYDKYKINIKEDHVKGAKHPDNLYSYIYKAEHLQVIFPTSFLLENAFESLSTTIINQNPSIY